MISLEDGNAAGAPNVLLRWKEFTGGITSVEIRSHRFLASIVDNRQASNGPLELPTFVLSVVVLA
jgi:hypothetical protein